MRKTRTKAALVELLILVVSHALGAANGRGKNNSR
jgi:hypothetical protein